VPIGLHLALTADFALSGPQKMHGSAEGGRGGRRLARDAGIFIGSAAFLDVPDMGRKILLTAQ
jgi:hypothetical protein